MQTSKLSSFRNKQKRVETNCQYSAFATKYQSDNRV